MAKRIRYSISSSNKRLEESRWKKRFIRCSLRVKLRKKKSLIRLWNRENLRVGLFTRKKRDKLWG